MEDIIKILNSVFKTLKLGSLNGLSYKYLKDYDNERNLYEECDWYEMPSFEINKDITKSPFIILELYNPNEKFYSLLQSKLPDIKITNNTSFFWFPYRPENYSKHKDQMYITEQEVKPKYPIYIISKGRYEKRYTSKYLEWCGIDYKIVVEPQEVDLYAEHIDRKKILVLPNKYLNLNQGGIPARNFVWEHSKSIGAKRHWILDDNIMSYKRLNDSDRTIVKSGVVFRAVEDYVDRYTNVAMAGHNYAMFGVSSNTNLKPIVKNTRIYSSILLSNELPKKFVWRGRYNEDTDLSLRILKDGYSTILFNAFLADKLKTLTQKGGNTDTIYAEKDALYKKAKSLADQHPDVAIVKERFGRTHHYVNYTPFKDNDPIFKKGIKLKEQVNNYGMKLVKKQKMDIE